ncbi:MAG: hypothetical protein LBR92_03840 [Puniceicoccales bacterium]|jgi:hypothetical protein|nr:hypothetical protein [Puniceicoccales bacterium]
MKKNKNIVIVSCLLTLLGGSIQVFASGENAERSTAPGIRCDTSRLPSDFRQKFRIGNYSINESNGDIRINRCDMLPCHLPNFIQAISSGNVSNFLADNPMDNAGDTIIYLQVGGGLYVYKELFERLIIVQNGQVTENLCHGYRTPWGTFSKSMTWAAHINDDRNIVEKLGESTDLGEDFQRGKVKIYVYHRYCNSLTSLHFDRHDEVVSSVDARRASVAKFKNVAQYASIYVGGTLLKIALAQVPLVGALAGPFIGVGASIAGCVALYKTYDIICPPEWKQSINAFVTGKVRDLVPISNIMP